MRRAPAVLLVLAVLVGACGGDDDDEGSAPVPRGPTPASALPEAPARDALAQTGRRLVASAGCLACHLMGGEGNDGPGPALSDVGARVPASAIRRTLVAPTAPMPSFRQLGDRNLDALTAYLTTLDGD